MIDIGIITGSGIYTLPGDSDLHTVETAFGRVEVAVSRVGPWTIGGVSRHGSGHRNLPHTVPHRANASALAELGARAILATTVVGAVDPGVPLGIPILFDDLFFPDNKLPDGSACTVFTKPSDPTRGHLVWSEPFAPRLRRKLALAAEDLGLESVLGGIYGHTNGPRFETPVEIRYLAAAGVTAVSQTCGPEVILAGELGIPYGLVGFPVNYATGVSAPEPEEVLARWLSRSTEVLPTLVLRAAELMVGEDLTFDHGYVFRVDGGIAT